jgi:mannose-6-phosphate isomerase-like protein (cupin superfamily)
MRVHSIARRRGDDVSGSGARFGTAAALLGFAAACLAFAPAGCGGPLRTGESTGAPEEAVSGAETTAADESVGGAAAFPTARADGLARGVEGHPRDATVAVPGLESHPWRAYDWIVAPATPARVLLASVELLPGDALRPPASTCQDALLFLREGRLEAVGTGIGSADAPATLHAGDAVRFGPEGDGVVINVADRPARAVMAVARRAGAGPARIPPPDEDACAVDAALVDPLRRSLRVASLAATPPLVAAGGRLQVRILLDADSAGAELGALSWLEGRPDLVVPEHRHDGSAEILLVEEGEGTMRIGDREVAVGAGAAIYVPEDTLHSFHGTGTRPLRAIQIYAPAGPEQRFRGP